MMASGVPTNQDCDPYADRRVYPRVPVALPAFLKANGERYAVLLLDLSAGGAKLDCPVSLVAGTAVILDCGTIGRSAVVRWQNGGLVGLCFDSELDGRDVSALLERSKALAAWRKARD
jgi:PilZ domain-containing protein